jgi:hypothetical protein
VELVYINGSENFMVEITDNEVIIGKTNDCTMNTNILQWIGKMGTYMTIFNPQIPIE